MDDRGWLAHCSTREQLEFFAEHGYLIVRDAVEPDLLRRLNESVDRVWSREREVQGLSAGDMLAKFRMVVEDEAFHELLDNPKTFPLSPLQLLPEHLVSHPSHGFLRDPAVDLHHGVTGEWNVPTHELLLHFAPHAACSHRTSRNLPEPLQGRIQFQDRVSHLPVVVHQGPVGLSSELDVAQDE